MKTDRELMQQALEAMKYADACLKKQLTAKTKHEYAQDLLMTAGTVLRERLARPEQKPLTEKRIIELYSFWVVDCHDIVGFARAIERSKPQMQPCAGRNCGSTNPNLHSAECFEDYEKATGMNQWQGLTDEEVRNVYGIDLNYKDGDYVRYARAIEQALKEKNNG